MNPKQLLINILSKFGFISGETLCLQGTMNPDITYPKEFITFWTDYTDDNGHLDDTVYSVDWHFTVIYYANDPALVNTRPFEFMTALREAGFIPQGKGNDIISDEPTHDGWVVEYIYTEKL